jgi:hypothetical protein
VAETLKYAGYRDILRKMPALVFSKAITLTVLPPPECASHPRLSHYEVIAIDDRLIYTPLLGFPGQSLTPLNRLTK